MDVLSQSCDTELQETEGLRWAWGIDLQKIASFGLLIPSSSPYGKVLPAETSATPSASYGKVETPESCETSPTGGGGIGNAVQVAGSLEDAASVCGSGATLSAPSSMLPSFPILEGVASFSPKDRSVVSFYDR